MLKITQEQIKYIRTDASQVFEEEMLAHSRSFSPRLCETLGEEGLRFATRSAIHRAHSYELNLRGSVRLFIELTLLFGSFFDEDPQYPWAGSILRSQIPEEVRARRLYLKVLDYLKHVSGQEDAFVFSALRRLEGFAKQPIVHSANFTTFMLSKAEELHPEKRFYVGAGPLTVLFNQGEEDARRYGMGSNRSKVLICALMFSFGHGCSRDPLYPWIGRTLEDERIASPQAREKRLESKALTWLRSVLESESIREDR